MVCVEDGATLRSDGFWPCTHVCLGQLDSATFPNLSFPHPDVARPGWGGGSPACAFSVLWILLVLMPLTLYSSLQLK